MTLQFHYGCWFLSEPEKMYANGIYNLEKIRIDVGEWHIMLFQKLVLEFDIEKIEMFGCRVN